MGGTARTGHLLLDVIQDKVEQLVVALKRAGHCIIIKEAKRDRTSAVCFCSLVSKRQPVEPGVGESRGLLVHVKRGLDPETSAVSDHASPTAAGFLAPEPATHLHGRQ